MALPTSGKVIIETSVGDIEIELWAKETPKTCRNFLALAMEGYYDGVIFHRIVPGFLVQTGDRTGTGAGGESFYGDVLKIGQAGGSEAKLGSPPKIKTVRIIDDPFGDIVPRITAAEKRAQQMARENAQRAREEAIRRKGAKKNVALLSFGDNAEAEDEPVIFTKKSLSRPDLVDNPDTRSAVAVPEPPKPRTKPTESVPKPTQERVEQDDSGSKKVDNKEGDLTSIRKKHKSEKDAKKQSEKTELEKMEEAVRKIARRHEDSDSENEREAKKPKGPSQLELELAKYKKGRGDGGKKGKGKGRDEGDLLAALSSFRGRLQKSLGDEDEDGDVGMEDGPESKEKAEGEQPEEVDNDSSWIGHKLKFAKDDGSETRRAEHEYSTHISAQEVIDPRARSSQAKMEERERKANKRSNIGQAFQKGRR
ncbi:Peptidyl-prolyl isomerase cwc27 [Rhizoctonia solani]